MSQFKAEFEAIIRAKHGDGEIRSEIIAEVDQVLKKISQEAAARVFAKTEVKS